MKHVSKIFVKKTSQVELEVNRMPKKEEINFSMENLMMAVKHGSCVSMFIQEGYFPVLLVLYPMHFDY